MDTPRRPRVLPIAAGLVIAYLLFVPNRAGREAVVRAAWSAPVTTATAPAPGGSGAAGLRGFRIGGAFGYVDPATGRVAMVESVHHDVAISDRAFVNYAKVPQELVLRSPDGRILATLREDGWPLLDDRDPEGLTVFAPDLLGLASYGFDGSLRWRKELGSLVSCYASFPSAPAAAEPRCAVGSLDGVVRVLGGNGAELFRAASTGSRYAGVYGCAVSDDGRLLAAILGLEPQRLVVYERQSGAFRELWSRELADEARSERVLRFAGGGRRLVLEGPGGIRVRDTRGGREWAVAAEGVLYAVAGLGGAVAAETRRDDGGGELVVVVLPDLVVGRAALAPLDSGGRFLAGGDGYLLVGNAGVLARVELVLL